MHRTERRAEGARPRDLDRRIAADRGYTHAARAAPQHQQQPIGAVPIFPRTHPRKLRGSGHRLEPISLQILVQYVRTDLKNPARVSLLNRLEQGDKIKMQLPLVNRCREEDTASVDVLRRRPHAGRWERRCTASRSPNEDTRECLGRSRRASEVRREISEKASFGFWLDDS